MNEKDTKAFEARDNRARLQGVRRVATEALTAAVAAAAAVKTGTVACGCGRAYVVLSSKNDRTTVNAVAAVCKTLGLLFLRKAYGTTGPSIYLGYDNGTGLPLAKAEAFAKELEKHGVRAYTDAVAD